MCDQVGHHFGGHLTVWRRATILAGIGEATVRKLVATGCKVVIADVSLQKGEALAAELRGNAAFCRCDVTCVFIFALLISVDKLVQSMCMACNDN